MSVNDPYAADSGVADKANQAKQAASGAASKARDTAMSQLGSQKDKAAGAVSSVADSLRQASQGLQQNQQIGPVAGYVQQAAEQLDRFSQSISQKPPEEIVSDVERFARQQPALFLGLAFAAGLGLSRFLKSSRRGDSLMGRVTDAVGNVASEQRVSEPVAEPASGAW